MTDAVRGTQKPYVSELQAGEDIVVEGVGHEFTKLRKARQVETESRQTVWDTPSAVVTTTGFRYGRERLQSVPV